MLEHLADLDRDQHVRMAQMESYRDEISGLVFFPSSQDVEELSRLPNQIGLTRNICNPYHPCHPCRRGLVGIKFLLMTDTEVSTTKDRLVPRAGEV